MATYSLGKDTLFVNYSSLMVWNSHQDAGTLPFMEEIHFSFVL